MDSRAGKQVHDLVNFVGLRAQATAVGLLQLSAELVRAGVLGEEALARIKTAIGDDLELSRPYHVSKDEFARTTRGRLDRLFAGDESLTRDYPASSSSSTEDITAAKIS
jgi:hypothetical protein